MCSHVETVHIWRVEKWQCHVLDWHFVSLTAVGEEAGSDEDERHFKEKMPSDDSQKGGKDLKEGGRPQCPMLDKRRTPLPKIVPTCVSFTTVWSSWRPSTCSGSRQHFAASKPKGKGNGKGKNKGGKGYLKGKGKGHLSKMQIAFGIA